jgi:hypothetical protein
MLALHALCRLRVDASSFKTDMLKLRGNLANVPAMIELSTGLLIEHLSLLNANAKTLFP